MLVLTRKPGEQIVIDGAIVVTVLNVQGNRVRIGIQAPQSVPIARQELCETDRKVVSAPCSSADVLTAS